MCIFFLKEFNEVEFWSRWESLFQTVIPRFKNDLLYKVNLCRFGLSSFLWRVGYLCSPRIIGIIFVVLFLYIKTPRFRSIILFMFRMLCSLNNGRVWAKKICPANISYDSFLYFDQRVKVTFKCIRPYDVTIVQMRVNMWIVERF